MINQIITGDARELSAQVPDASIDLIFTDPEYSDRALYDALGAIALRVLRPGGAVLCWSNGKWHHDNAAWLEAAGLIYRYDFGCVISNASAPMNGKIISKTNRLIWLDVDHTSKMRGYLPDGYLSVGGAWLIPRSGFSWGKSNSFSLLALKCFSAQGEIVLDPFCGEATIPAVAKVINRNFIGFEIDPARAERARRRLENTQAIDPVFLEEQATLL